MIYPSFSFPSQIACSLLLMPFATWFHTTPPPAQGFGVSKESVFWATFFMMTAILLFAFVFVTVGLLRSRDWYLGDALSEEADNQPNPLPVGQKPIMVASTSRLLALLGLLNILGCFSDLVTISSTRRLLERCNEMI